MSQENQPLVSIVIPCYNHEGFVQDCIRSVIDQTYQNIELIIIDDGSKDNSVTKIQKLLEKCKARFARFEFRHRPNVGLSATLNEALEWSRGEYFSVIASDDMIFENKTTTQVVFLEEHQTCIAVCGGISIIDQDSNEISQRVLKANSFNFDQVIMLEHELPAPTQMIRLEILKKTGGYDTDIKLEDWYMWLLLAQKGELYYIPKLFSKYRSHESNTFKQINTMHNGRMQILELYKNHPLYQKARKRIFWIHSFELCEKSKKDAFLSVLNILKKNKCEFFSKNFIWFFYYLMFK